LEAKVPFVRILPPRQTQQTREEDLAHARKEAAERVGDESLSPTQRARAAIDLMNSDPNLDAATACSGLLHVASLLCEALENGRKTLYKGK
jgi:hypothetical protein